jgi:hypothetical protein
MATIYIVTSGEYSDYGIDAVFSTRELAEAYIKQFQDKWQTMGVEEWTLDPWKKELRKGYKLYSLHMDKAGNTVDISAQSYGSYGLRDGEPYQGWDANGNMTLCLLARNETHAIKIANEKRAMLIANNLWRGRG